MRPFSRRSHDIKNLLFNSHGNESDDTARSNDGDKRRLAKRIYSGAVRPLCSVRRLDEAKQQLRLSERAARFILRDSTLSSAAECVAAQL